MNDFLANLSRRESLVLLLAMLTSFAACFKFAAHLYRRTNLTWPNAWLVLGAVLVSSMLLPPMRGVPFAVRMAIGLFVVVAVGAVVLKFRAKTADGQPLGNADAVKISAMGYGFLSVVMGAIVGVLYLLFYR